MTDELKQQIEDDINMARAMTDINSSQDILALVNRLIGYLDIVLKAKADLDYKADLMSGKKRILEEFIRTGKDRAKTISILEHENRQ